MQLIIDANILVAAFLKSAVTRELIFDDEITLLAPEYFSLEVASTLKKDKIIPEEEYHSFLKTAERYVPANDAPYLALSLSLQIPIWSNDAAFKKQFLVRVYTTHDLAKIFK